MSGERLFKPSERGRRDPLSNQKQNGRVANPPRMSEVGGFDRTSKGFSKNDKTIQKPGSER